MNDNNAAASSADSNTNVFCLYKNWVGPTDDNNTAASSNSDTNVFCLYKNCVGSTNDNQYKATPYKCPICEGKGVVRDGFYTSIDHITLSEATEQCRQCKGTGIIWG